MTQISALSLFQRYLIIFRLGINALRPFFEIESLSAPLHTPQNTLHSIILHPLFNPIVKCTFQDNYILYLLYIVSWRSLIFKINCEFIVYVVFIYMSYNDRSLSTNVFSVSCKFYFTQLKTPRIGSICILNTREDIFTVTICT